MVADLDPQKILIAKWCSSVSGTTANILYMIWSTIIIFVEKKTESSK